jgi:hypothetical protein
MWGGMLTATNPSSAVAVHCAANGTLELLMPGPRVGLPPILLVTLLLACGTELAPPDQLPCEIRGTLTPGVTRSGFLGEANCDFQSDVAPGLATTRDRWTIRVHPGTVYVVTARYLPRAGRDPWSGKLLGYLATEIDTLLHTGYWGTSGTPSGEQLHEMLLASPLSRVMLVHLERATAGDSGNYRLEARRCPILHLEPETTYSEVSVGPECSLWTAGTPGMARFFDYPSDSGVLRVITVTPDDPNVGVHFAWASHPPLNFACWYAAGSCDLGTGGVAPFTFRPEPVDGITAGMIFTLGLQTTATLRVDSAP